MEGDQLFLFFVVVVVVVFWGGGSFLLSKSVGILRTANGRNSNTVITLISTIFHEKEVAFMEVAEVSSRSAPIPYKSTH